MAQHTFPEPPCLCLQQTSTAKNQSICQLLKPRCRWSVGPDCKNIKLPHPEGFNPRTFQRFAPAYYKFLGGGHPIPYFHSKIKRYSKAGSDISISGKLNELRELWDTVGGYLVVGYEGKGGGWALEEWKGRWKLFGVRMWHG
jgi:hypothetical protein